MNIIMPRMYDFKAAGANPPGSSTHHSYATTIDHNTLWIRLSWHRSYVPTLFFRAACIYLQDLLTRLLLCVATYQSVLRQCWEGICAALMLGHNGAAGDPTCSTHEAL
ncbi:hypothetical protein VFPPC_17544 [Pochonia chlamydosporia 170]|uniref:Uncharacterized protein n=1 Tax=Pochonia chlamydosporia 170 TaxID=1380566 RepID=A0A219AR82_METCM|nr:hypothetical protein VFPPC_17544 [Pochonia chlamydosporia 170]OWT43293.1 hypothetical protein VFPPC_17544 [Pochonia chlamydosporia 170]